MAYWGYVLVLGFALGMAAGMWATDWRVERERLRREREARNDGFYARMETLKMMRQVSAMNGGIAVFVQYTWRGEKSFYKCTPGESVEISRGAYEANQQRTPVENN